MINVNLREAFQIVPGDVFEVLARAAALEALRAAKANYEKCAGLDYVERVAKHLASLEAPALTIEAVNETLDKLANSAGGADKALHQRLTGRERSHGEGFRPRHKASMKAFLGLWLLALRANGALVLPYHFTLPFKIGAGGHRAKSRLELHADGRGELLDFIRSLRVDPIEAESNDAAFASIPEGGRHMFLSYVTKMIFALGWIKPEDASMEDVLELRRAFNALPESGRPKAVWKDLIIVLKAKFQARFALSVEDFEQALAEASKERKANQRALAAKAREGEGEDPDFMSAKDFALDAALKRGGFAHSKAAVFEIAKPWLKIQEAYFAKTRMESQKPVKGTCGHLNAYLFGYLHQWMMRHPDSGLVFPATPSLLKRSVFVSRLLRVEETRPLTLIEFFDELQKKHDWANNTLYARVKHVEGVFQFIADYASELPDSRGFTQPITKHDYPRTNRSPGATKGLIPRQVFGFLISYVEALCDYAQSASERAFELDRGLSDTPAAALLRSPRSSPIDAKSLESTLGPAPRMSWKGKEIVLETIPNLLDLAWLSTAAPDGSCSKKLLPRPHTLRHIAIALQTGIRGNHIQWLDAALFDQHAQEDEPFTRLWVNTDKFKSSGWSPYVSQRVVEALKKQKAWRDKIAEPAFAEKRFYNDNESSKWGQFLPLFSYAKNGSIYSDNLYLGLWKELLLWTQIEMQRAGFDCPQLVRLQSPGASFDEPGRLKKLAELAKGEANVCPLVITSNITPHSARVSIVSHFISALPADFIGKHVTGQTPAVVAYYTKLDPDYLHRQEQQQGMEADRMAHQRAFNALISGEEQEGFIQADGPQSGVARALSRDYAKAVSSFGCMSLGAESEAKTGLDHLEEAIGRNASFNKTEICPHGNHCPPEIVVQLKGRGRCGVCPRAVRSVDHLPAIAAKCRQMYEELTALDARFAELAERLSESDEETLEAERQKLSEELVGWIVAQEVLEASRQRLAIESDGAALLAQEPEIIKRALAKVAIPTEETRYVLARLAEADAYPNLSSPQIRAKFDLLRRRIAANAGDFNTAFQPQTPANEAGACVGMIRSVMKAHQLTYEGLATALSTPPPPALTTPAFGLLGHQEGESE